MEKDPHSKIALVTGGSSGIGKAIVKKLINEGMKVVVADVEVTEEQEGLFFRKCDVSKGEDIDALYSWMKENLGAPEVMVLNAGKGIKEKLVEGDPEKWEKILHINLMGPLRCIRSFVPDMMEQGQGNVVIISSVSAYQPHPYGAIYAASKTALEVVAETLRQETLPHINVTVVSPGIVDSKFFENEISGDTNIDELGMGSISAEEIAENVWFALNQKEGTSINKIITRPTGQIF